MRSLDWLAGLRLGGLRVRRRRAIGPVEVLESRYVLAEDFGDAPDTGPGTGAVNYETLLANGGPQHTIVAGLFLGARVDGEADATQNLRANGDDSTPNIGPDDEDGVVNPQGDFLLTPGTQPTVTLRATNTTGTAATLSGWIDFNNNGVFDNASERAQVVVQAGTTNGTFTLTFPVVPTGFTGRSYARFRLSSDVAAANPTGAATNGEVEDYAVTITGLSSGTVKTVGGASKLASGGLNMPTLENDDFFGGSVANMGDLNGDGVADLAVGAFGDDTGGSVDSDRGAVHILLLNADGMVMSRSKIAAGIGGAPSLLADDNFGSSVANVGDLDGDGVTDLAVGARSDNTNGTDRGAVYILFLNTNRTVKSSTKIASGIGGGPELDNGNGFGVSVASVGDLDGDGVADLAVGAYRDLTGGADRGAVHLLFLNTNGTVKSSTKIASETGGGPALSNLDNFGRSVANVGDLDWDGVTDLAVGASGDNTSGTDRGAVHLLFLNTNGTVKSSTKIAHQTGGGPALSNFDYFGRSVANVGDLDGDGVADLAVGAHGDDPGGTQNARRGAVHVLFLNASGTVKSSTKIASGTGGGPTLADGDYFGYSVTNVGDLDGDGVVDLAAGAVSDDSVGSGRGAVHILRLNVGTALRDFGDAPDATNGTGAGNYQTRNGDSGPSHAIVNGLLLGTRISGETDATANTRANGDDIGIDDEDGVVNPQVDFLLTPGMQPTVTLRATNTTGTAATLSGWIDFNNNGVFDNASERAQISVPAGTTNGTFTLTFPVVPTGFTGRTYARFRLSSDVAAANPTGAATNGEVEDYVVTITGPSSGTVKANGATKLANGGTNMPPLADLDGFGRAVANVGDLNGDGVADLAVGAYGDDATVADSGAVHILFLNASGGVTSRSKIANGNGGGPALGNFDNFGSSVANVGDLDGDGVTDLAVGAPGDDTGGVIRGAVHILFLKNDGTVKSITKIASGIGGGPTLDNGDNFGRSVANVGDLDGDGVADLAVGATGDDTNGTSRGAVHILFLQTDGTVKSSRSTKIASGTGGGPALSDFDNFGSSVANVGDLDGDGVADLAVGALGDDTNGNFRGAVHLLFLKTDGTVKSSTKIADETSGGPTLRNGDYFGGSVSNVGDLDGDGVADLAVGAYGDDTGGNYRGAVHVLFLNAGGTVKSSTKIASGTGGGPTLTNSDFFGHSVANMGDLDGDGVADLAVGADGDDTGGSLRGAVHILRLNVGTALRDFGDAPDATNGTGAGNYQTRNGDSGPSHAIVNGLLLGTRISGETDATANTRANGDDIGIDDEDGVVNPQGDFLLTTGTQPTVTLRATNTTGTAATLSGWIDTNNNGVFDNPSERAQIAVPAGTNNGTFTLTFPVVPTGFTGRSYARFRLSSDVAAANPTGAATNGEVEDYAVTITGLSDGTVKAGGATKLASGGTNMPMLANIDFFGSSVANVGDLDGDGVSDLAVGASGDDTGGPGRGAVHLLFLDTDGTVKSSTKIAHQASGGPTLVDFDLFGSSVANVGDLDGDGVTDLAVGARGDDTGGTDLAERGAVYILFLNASGTVRSSTKIASGTSGASALSNGDYFGSSVSNVGDLDGDGVADLAVGAPTDDTGGNNRGAVHLLFLKTDGTVKSRTKIAHQTSGGPTLVDYDFFGNSVANVGDLDGDGVADLAVGANGDDTGGSGRGAVHLLFLNTDGTVKSSTKIANGTNGGPTLADDDFFGNSVASVGDLDGDGVTDLAVGASSDNTNGTDRGAAHILFLNASGTVKSRTKIAHQTGGGPALSDFDYFGRSMASAGDLDGDGVTDLAVGANGDDTGGNLRGAVHILRLNVANRAPTGLALAPQSIAENSAIGTTIGTFTTTDPNAGNTFTYALVGGAGSTDNASFTISGNTLQSNAVFDFETKSSYAIRVRTTDQGGLSFEQTFTVSVTNGNDAPVLDASGNVFAILGVGSRQSIEMRQGTLVSDILARGAGGNPISDVDAGAQRGIAITGFDATFGMFQFTLATSNPAESDWTDFNSAGPVTNESSLLLPETARIRFNNVFIPHHSGGVPFLPLGTMLNTGLTFRAWDRSSGNSGGRGDSSTNGGTTAFSLATETAKVYFEARLFRSFNTNAGLNIYTLEAEFNALTGNPAIVDRSTSAFTGFTILMSDVPELGTAPLFRMYFGVQFNDDGTQTDMGYRYLTSNAGEAEVLEGLGRADLRPTRQGAYFREIGDPRIPGDTGVNNGTAIIGYIYATQQPGTAQMTQVYRTDNVGKPTRPPGTVEGSTPTSTREQEQGDHVYTTNTAFETSRPGTWRVEAARGFVRELTPSPTGGPPPAVAMAVAATAGDTSGEARRRMAGFAPTTSVEGARDEREVASNVARLIANAPPVAPSSVGAISYEADEVAGRSVAVAYETIQDAEWSDQFFSDTMLVADCLLSAHPLSA